MQADVCVGPSFGEKTLTAYCGALEVEDAVWMTAELARCQDDEVSDRTSGLRSIEAITAAGGLSDHGPVEFTPNSRSRRKSFGDFTGALRLYQLQPAAPANTRFEATTTAADLAAQMTAAAQPMPTRPGADQTVPRQEH